MEQEEKKIPRDIFKGEVVETYAEDMMKVIQDDREGLIKKVINTEAKHEIEKSNISPTSTKNRLFMIMGLILILASFAILIFFYLQTRISDIPVQKQFIPIIFTDKSASLEITNLNKSDIEKKVSDQVNATTVKAGGVEAIYLTQNKVPIGLRKFITLIEGSLVPDSNNFLDDNFLMGVAKHGNSTLFTKDFFILFKMRSMSDVFDAMRAWESKMFIDLYKFFGISLSPETKYLLTKEFTNGIVENKNARILYDKDNKVIIMYVFADDNSLVITNTENTVREIILRLASSEIKK